MNSTTALLAICTVCLAFLHFGFAYPMHKDNKTKFMQHIILFLHGAVAFLAVMTIASFFGLI